VSGLVAEDLQDSRVLQYYLRIAFCDVVGIEGLTIPSPPALDTAEASSA